MRQMQLRWALCMRPGLGERDPLWKKRIRGQKAEGVPHFMLEMPGNIFWGFLGDIMSLNDIKGPGYIFDMVTRRTHWLLAVVIFWHQRATWPPWYPSASLRNCGNCSFRVSPCPMRHFNVSFQQKNHQLAPGSASETMGCSCWLIHLPSSHLPIPREAVQLTGASASHPGAASLS